jgi:hypothetical protein
LLKSIKPAVARGQTDELARVLTSDYDLLYVLDGSTARTFTRAAYLSYIANISRVHGGPTGISYNVYSINVNRKQGEVLLSAVSTYQYQYFSLHFLESLLFKKNNNSWFLARQVFLPLSGETVGHYNISVYLLKMPVADVERYLRPLSDSFFIGNVDQILSSVLSSATDSIIGDEGEYTILFVFKQPPPPGALIVVEHQFTRPGLGALEPYRFTYTASSSDPFFVFASGTHASFGCAKGKFCEGGTITYSATINGTKAAEKTVKILAP